MRVNYPEQVDARQKNECLATVELQIGMMWSGVVWMPARLRRKERSW